MPTHIALLRGINVGGHNKVAMSALRDLCGDLGLGEAKSLLQSGNLVFECSRLAGASLEGFLEKETAKRLGVSADYIVRSASEWKKVIALNPFARAAKDDPSHLVVMFMKSAPATKDVAALQDLISGPEIIKQAGKHLFIVYPAGIGTSKLTGTLIEKKLGVRGTARNWNTVTKLAALSET